MIEPKLIVFALATVTTALFAQETVRGAVVRKTKFAVLFLFLTGVAHATLIHEYMFDGNADDLTGSANGTLINGAIADNGILSLNGTNQYVQFGSQIVPTSGSYSVALFAKETTPTSGLVEFISQGATYSPVGFYIGHDAGTPQTLRVTDAWQNTSAFFPTDGMVHSYVLVVNAFASDSLLYIDGSLAATLGSAIESTPVGDDARLGRQYDPFGEFLAGDLANVQIYSNALTSKQVAMYEAEGPTPTTPTPTPEPSAFLLLTAGLIGLCALCVGRSKHNKSGFVYVFSRVIQG